MLLNFKLQRLGLTWLSQAWFCLDLFGWPGLAWPELCNVMSKLSFYKNESYKSSKLLRKGLFQCSNHPVGGSMLRLTFQS